MIEENILELQRSARLIARLDDNTYRARNKSVWDSTIGGHFRHNLDHYTAFFVGLKAGIIDYEQRQRLQDLEVNRQAALSTINNICRQLSGLDAGDLARMIRVRCNSKKGAELACSSVLRELDFLVSHTVHHHAIIAISCALHNKSVDADFGVAPSTLRYRSEGESNSIRVRGSLS